MDYNVGASTGLMAPDGGVAKLSGEQGNEVDSLIAMALCTTDYLVASRASRARLYRPSEPLTRSGG